MVTPIYGEFIDPDKIEETLPSFNGFHPIGRVGCVDNVAAVVEFFLSDDAGWIIGSIWDVDGGVMAVRTNKLIPRFVSGETDTDSMKSRRVS